MSKPKHRRLIGEPPRFKQLARAPVNGLCVVYLFGVPHDAFDFHIESVHSSFRGCTARPGIGQGPWG